VDAINTMPPNANKTKLKTNEQYISILYTNLFQKALSANEMVEITHCIEAFGDKETIHEVIISNFMNDPDVIIPSYTKISKLGLDTITYTGEITSLASLMCMDPMSSHYDESVIFINPKIDDLLEDAYIRFYVRDITEAEKEYLINFFEVNPTFSAEMLYTAFALSDEYQYY
jgi:hypothetical protein